MNETICSNLKHNTTSMKKFHGESEVDDLINADLDSVSKWETC